MVMNALVKEVAIYAGIPDNSKVEDCLDRCFQLQEDFPDALIHKARVSRRQELFSAKGQEEMLAV